VGQEPSTVGQALLPNFSDFSRSHLVVKHNARECTAYARRVTIAIGLLAGGVIERYNTDDSQPPLSWTTPELRGLFLSPG